jgi:lysophospholipase L1-like esterase
LHEAKQYYSFASARKDPIAFMHWWGLFNCEWDQMSRALFMRDPAHLLPYRVRPNAHGRLFQSAIRMNSLGFRGKDFPTEKGSAYRVIALGESTTFGCTLGAGDRPWPELLEEMIQERFKPNRPVEVINAGLPGFNLRDNLRRLADQILPLAPDLILSYHGYNGFPMLDTSLPPVSGHTPQYTERPLRLLADVEYRFKMLKYRHQLGSKRAAGGTGFTNLLQSDYAQAYRELIELAKSNAVPVVVANFSMAVNGRSDPDEVAFYQLGFPFVDRAIKANAAHSELLRRMTQEYPNVCFVNTQPNLDGHHDKFIDLVHLTQLGRQDLAEAFFLGIRDLLKTQLAQPAPQSRAP